MTMKMHKKMCRTTNVWCLVGVATAACAVIAYAQDVPEAGEDVDAFGCNYKEGYAYCYGLGKCQQPWLDKNETLQANDTLNETPCPTTYMYVFISIS